jgi:hypothetical protein
MSNQFDNPLVRDIQKILNEQDDGSYTLMVNGKVAKSIDFSESVDDPNVYLFGSGTVRLSTIKKMIKQDIVKFADLVGNRDAKDLLVFLTDFEGKKSSNMYFAFRLYGLMEVEEFMKRPDTKRKITLIKKKKSAS